MYRLSRAMIDSLLRKPESGMGYQLVAARMGDYELVNGVVLGGRLLLLEGDQEADRRLLATKSLPELAVSAPIQPRELRSLLLREPASRAVREAKSSGAAESPVEESDSGERFFRFSAFKDDVRIAADRGLVPGSYATTEADGRQVATGAEAVERYALPNDDPASFRFTIDPDARTAIRRGIAQPAFGRRGGGAEVIFPEGTQAGSVTLPPTELPDS